MTNRITTTLSSSKARGEKALALFLTAGFPRLDSTVDLARALEEGGADLIELGMPFSDPLADGPVIQQSSTAALANGMNLHVLLDQLEDLRQRSQIPVVLMGYLNPILRYGADRFFMEVARRGADGLILPELPLEEIDRFTQLYRESGLARILLVAPTADQERIAAIDRASSGFLYCVSVTGVTGVTGQSAVGSADEHIRRVTRAGPTNPVMVGCGISTPEAARHYSLMADGVIVGSALLRKISEARSYAALTAWVREVKRAMRAQ